MDTANQDVALKAALRSSPGLNRPKRLPSMLKSRCYLAPQLRHSAGPLEETDERWLGAIRDTPIDPAFPQKRGFEANS